MNAPAPWRNRARESDNGVGIYDRDYYREERRVFSVRAPRTVVAVLVLLNVAFYVADYFTPATARTSRWLSDAMAVHLAGDPQWPETLTHPWMWWQFLTYGFAHSPVNFWHILGNMLGLWFLGRDIESTYGSREFLRLYLALIVVGGLVWGVANALQGQQAGGEAYGASGAVAGIVVLYALNFPRRTLLLFFVVPVPAWLCGVLLVLSDMFGAVGMQGQTHVAYVIHLGGAAFAFLYHQLHWRLTRLSDFRFKWPQLRRPPELRIHDPADDYEDLTAEVDRILEKIHREGEGSLTRKERRTLEEASREYQKRRGG
jgi:membrane associated rhomboid family serine protease